MQSKRFCFSFNISVNVSLYLSGFDWVMCASEPVYLVTGVGLERGVPPLEPDVVPCEGHGLSLQACAYQAQQDPRDGRRVVGMNSVWSDVTFKGFLTCYDGALENSEGFGYFRDIGSRKVISS